MEPHRKRNRRARRRQIHCPLHGCALDSASQKHYLYLDQAGQLQVRGMGKHTALMVLAVHGQVALRNEWLECFWCTECQKRTWYHVIRQEDGTYQWRVAPEKLWHQVSGVVDPRGNPSVGEFTRRSSRATGVQGLQNYRFL